MTGEIGCAKKWNFVRIVLDSGRQRLSLIHIQRAKVHRDIR
jgi:hypothetical protein